MKNVIYIPYIKREKDLSKSSVGQAGRHSGYDWGIKSWESWCEKNDVELYVMDKLVCKESDMLITWQRYYMMDILDRNKIEYDQILLVDADSIIHPDCPDFFALTERKFSSILVNGDNEWVARAIKGYSELFFLDKIPDWQFFQTGFTIWNKDHKDFLHNIVEFYWKNKDKIIWSYDHLRTGSDQPLINLLRNHFNVELFLLPRQYSLTDLTRKNLLYLDQKCWWQDDLSNLYNSGHVYQMNSLPPNPMNRDRAYYMQRIYEELYENK